MGTQRSTSKSVDDISSTEPDLGHGTIRDDRVERTREVGSSGVAVSGIREPQMPSNTTMDRTGLVPESSRTARFGQ